MNNQKTPLQEAICWYENQLHIARLYGNTVSHDWILNHLKEMLPKEKEVIVNAFFNGGKDVSTRDYEDAETYYHQTFNTQE